MLQREKSLHVIINVPIRAKDKIEGWGPFDDNLSRLSEEMGASLVDDS